MRKILYSPGFGAGWTTWESDPKLKAFMLEYRPFIDFIENGGDCKELEPPNNYYEGYCYKTIDGHQVVIGIEDESIYHPLMLEFVKTCIEQFHEVPCLGGVEDLQVMEVSGRVRIDEYDGAESVEQEGEYSEWL